MSRNYLNLLPTATTILLQLEIPIEAVVAAAKGAKNVNIIVILDPAPAQSQLPDELYPLIDNITPNEIEASQLVGFPVNGEETAAKAAKILLQRGVKCAVIKSLRERCLLYHYGRSLLYTCFSS
jgi:ribokinase